MADSKFLEIDFQSQEEAVLWYIALNGQITNIDATYDLGITRLSAKVFTLRLEGYPIFTDKLQSPYMNRYGKHSIYGGYRFIRTEEELKWYLSNYGYRMSEKARIMWDI